MNSLGLRLYCVLLLALGSYCVFWPRSVQSYAIKAVSMGVTANYRALRVFIRALLVHGSRVRIGCLSDALDLGHRALQGWMIPECCRWWEAG